MHELAVCQSLVAEVARVAAAQGASSVESVSLAIGPLAGVEPHLLKAAFPIAVAGSVAEGASLLIEETQIRVRCGMCGAESDAANNRIVCGQCGAWRVDVISGDELLLKSVSLTRETPKPEPNANAV